MSKCEFCGANMIVYEHKLNTRLINCLFTLAKNGGSCRSADLGFDYSERSNFPKLRYWGLIRYEQSLRQNAYVWTITDTGWSFLTGELAVPEYALVYRNKVKNLFGDEKLIEEFNNPFDRFRRKEDYLAHSESIADL